MNPSSMQSLISIVDELIFSHTGEHLDDLQQAILKGALDYQKYAEIAKDNHRSEKYVKDVAAKLWQTISGVLGEEVSKSNIKATLGRYHYSNFLNLVTDSIQIYGKNVCAKLPDTDINSDKSIDNQNINQIDSKKDLSDLPVLQHFYGRTQELDFLERTIISEQYRLIEITGLPGIGKTTLVAKLIEKIQADFDYIIYRSLKNRPQLVNLIDDIINFINHSQKEPINYSSNDSASLLKMYFRKYRCLIILDDIEFLFSYQQIAGTYQNGYNNYGDFFQTLGEISHQSCVMLLSSEQCREVPKMTHNNSDCLSFQITELDERAAKEVIKAEGLQEEEYWDKLIKIYLGNPLYLKLVCLLIKDLFAENISDFLNYEQPVLSNDLISIFETQIKRLSETEIKVVHFLARQCESLSIKEIQKNIDLSSLDLLNACQSLKRRLIIQTHEESNQVYLEVIPLLKEYISNV